MHDVRILPRRALLVAGVITVFVASCTAVPPEPRVEPQRAPAPSVAGEAVEPQVTAPPATKPSAAQAPQPAAREPMVAPEAAPAPQTKAPPAAQADRPARTPPAKATAPSVAAPPPKAAAAPPKASGAPPLDLKSLESRLRETKAIGVYTKLTLKNQVDDLLDAFRAYYKGQAKSTLAELRRAYDLLVLKVIALLQDADPPLASAIASSREAIWGILSDPAKFAAV